jgi:hypothetical protein
MSSGLSHCLLVDTSMWNGTVGAGIEAIFWLIWR